MSARYVIIVDTENARVSDSIATVIQEQAGMAWWHWMQPAWLIVDELGRGVQWWRDLLSPHVRTAPLLVIHVPQDSSDWASHNRPRKFDWLHDNWSGTPKPG